MTEDFKESMGVLKLQQEQDALNDRRHRNHVSFYEVYAQKASLPLECRTDPDHFEALKEVASYAERIGYNRGIWDMQDSNTKARTMRP